MISLLLAITAICKEHTMFKTARECESYYVTCVNYKPNPETLWVCASAREATTRDRSF